MSAGSRSYGSNVLVSVAAVGLMSAMALGNNVVIARAAGPEGRGVYGLAVAIGALALPIASAGLGSATTWQLGRGQPLGQLLALARRAISITLAISLATAGVMHLGLGLALGEATEWAVLAAALALPAQVIVEIGRGVALGRGRAVAYNLCSAAVIAVLLGLNSIAAVRGLPGTSWVVLNLVFANWAVALVLLCMTWGRLEPAAPPLVGDTLRYGARSAAVALGDAALLRVDYLVAAPIIGLASLGVYAIADQISHLMAWVGLLAGKMMLPEAAADDDDDASRSLGKLALACRLIVAVTLAGAAVAIALGPWLINALFGVAFADAYLALLILLPATLSKSLHALVATWLQGRGDQRPIVRASAIAIAVELLAVVVFALSFGWLGVAVAKAGAYVVQLGLSLAALRRHRSRLPDDDGHVIPGGRWLLDRSDLRTLQRWLAARRRANP
ncbi:lipopolysaccharide biosynthesis protein [Enhygromyxa salina]|uniref:Uncharacterized protein n=1 Tax=Enhygromyxa salina TaxID=215803 RepID=A0A2S9YSR0_9BACT|nr:lipopolysaccharide biosynthesis protein [Enhygromyxa salina]PRQ08118.1 hypothetical protein ENSA7_20900 [Enhygromyxa salina]